MSQFKKKLSAFSATLALIALGTGGAVAFDLAGAGNILGQTSNTEVIDNGTRHDINFKATAGGGAVGQIDFKDFKVDTNHHLNYGFSAQSQTMINRVLGGNESQILGKITNSCISGTCTDNAQSSKVILINPAGVLFGAGSTVDLNSLTVSTNDINGITNLTSLNADPSGITAAYSARRDLADGKIKFDRTYNTAFTQAGITADKLAETNQRVITLNGTKMGSFTDETHTAFDTELNPNKTIALIGDKVNYQDSLLRTGSNYNYIATAGGIVPYSNGNVSIVTTDGITFEYQPNGFGQIDLTNPIETTTSAAKEVYMKNTGLGNQDAVVSGDIQILNTAKNNNAQTTIKDTSLKALKLKNNAYGEIAILSDKNVIDNSKFATKNTSYNQVGSEQYSTTIIEDNHQQATTGNNTYDDYVNGSSAGKIAISANTDSTITNSKFDTAGSSNADATNAGDVELLAGNRIILSGSDIDSNGNITISAEDAKVLNSKLFAKNEIVPETNELSKKNILIDVFSDGTTGIEVQDSYIAASNNVSLISADDRSNLKGDINIKQTNPNTAIIHAGNDLKILSNNTTVDNGTLAYNTITFFDSTGSNFAGRNNVTIKNDTAFDKKGTDNVEVVTNGHLTLDKATMKKADSTLTYNAGADFKHSFTSTTKKAQDVTAQSTLGDVTVQNQSNVGATNNINVIATQGTIYGKESSKLNADKNVNLTSKNSVVFGNFGQKTDDSDVTIDRTVDIYAKDENVTVTSTNGSIKGEKTTMPTIKYGNRLVFNANKDNVFTSADSLKAVNVDYIAGNANRFYTTTDMQFVNSSLEAPTNFVESGHDVILNNLEIKNATTNPEDTVTEIFANGIVTTDDVTGTALSDATANPHLYPQSVSTIRNGRGKTTMDVNKTKLKVTTEVVKNASDPKNGTITLDLKNADNPNAGIELTAQNVEALNNDPTTGNFKTGYYKSGTPKWDENIGPNEGPEVHVDAVDDNLAISKIITDKLTLNSTDNLIAAPAELTPEQLAGLPDGTPAAGYLEVRDKGGFNLDDSPSYDPRPDDFTYTGNYVETDKKVEGGDVTFDPWSGWVETGRTENPDGSTTIHYENTRTGQVSDYIVTTTEKKHTIEFDNNGNPSDFILVYDKTKTEVTPGHELKYTDTDLSNFTNPETGRPLTPDDLHKEKNKHKGGPITVIPDSYINVTKIPRQQLEVSKTSTITDNTKNHTAAIMNAAAKVTISTEDTKISSTDDDEYDY